MAKILFLATEDWFFASHFLPLIKAARDCSLDVVIAARVDRHHRVLEESGGRVITLPVSRGKLGPFALIAEMSAIMRLLRKERPDIVHCVALRVVVLGGIASRLTGVHRMVLAVTGLGTLWLRDDFVSACARAMVRWIVRCLVARGALAVFENYDDPGEFGFRSDVANVIVVPGAGVNEADFPPTPEPPSPPVKFAIVSRMLRTKGIAEAVDAARSLRAEGAAVELHLFGSPDQTNRDSFDEQELRTFSAEPNVFWHGSTADIAKVWRDHHVALLLSYREGLPRALVEAAAASRPIIATDVPGCREVVRHGIEGILVPARQISAVATALQALAGDGAMRRRMGSAAHERFLAGFTEHHLREKIKALYRHMIAR